MTAAAQSRGRAREALDAICERLRRGTPINHACALENVPRRTFYDLLDADEEAATAVASARAAGAEAYRESLVDIALGNGEEGANANVLLHLMERLYPDDYAPPPKRVEQSGPSGEPIQHAVTVTIDEAKRIARSKETR